MLKGPIKYKKTNTDQNVRRTKEKYKKKNTQKKTNTDPNVKRTKKTTRKQTQTKMLEDQNIPRKHVHQNFKWTKKYKTKNWQPQR